jgi:IclR family acetate operon transcriptional repressor
LYNVPTQSVDRAIAILKEFSLAEPELGVSELARRLGLTKSTVHRLLASLREGNLVNSDPETHKYRLCCALVELGYNAVYSQPLLQTALPYLHYLAGQVGEAVYLAVRDREVVLTMMQVLSPSAADQIPWAPALPLHATASGKVLLTQMEDAELTSLLKKGLARCTENTITDPALLRQEVERVRERGYATCSEEQEAGVNSVSVPIRVPDGEVVAALTIVGPAYRLTREKIMASLEILKAISREITLKLA